MLDQITARLKAALPAGVPILQPPAGAPIPAEWQEEMPDGKIKPKGRRGLLVYLEQQAPAGYVQLYDLQPSFTQGGWADQHFLTVTCTATTEALAQAVAAQVRSVLGGTSRTGCRTRAFTPARVTRTPGSVDITLQFTVISAHPR